MDRVLRHAWAIAACAAVAGGSLAQGLEAWPARLTVATAGQGDAYSVYGDGMAALIAEELDLDASGVLTGGPAQNATLVQMQDHDIGLVSMGAMHEAWNGESALAQDIEHRDVRALFPMYAATFQGIALRAEGIASVRDLDGRHVSVGPVGGTSGTYWPRLLDALGVDAAVSYAGAADAASQLKDGRVDAFLFAAVVPIAAFSQLGFEADVSTFAFSADEQAEILAAVPELHDFPIPAGTYPAQETEQNAVAMWSFAVAHRDMPESLAYAITRLVLESNDRMVQIHEAAAATVPANWNSNGFLPFHPGAVRYYEEIGIDIPQDLRG